MFAPLTLTALTFLAAVLVVRADPSPSEPGPGDVYNEGATCHIVWGATAANSEVWKTMNIELMTGDNFNMVHLTTVATVDGSVAGVFDFPCPKVDPNSAIYFYQFTSPEIPDAFWTTRFAIAGPDGQTTPPANPRQPGTNAPIPWGVGRLEDPSSATPPPTRGGGAPAAGSSAALPGDGPSTSAPSVSASSSSPAVSSPVSSVVVTSSNPSPPALPTTSFASSDNNNVNTRFVTSTSTTTGAPTGLPSGSAEAAQNGAISRLALGLWTSVTAISLSAFGLVTLL